MKKQVIVFFVVLLLFPQSCSKEPMQEEQWSRLFGGSGEDFARDMIQSKDGGFLLCGGTISSDGDILLNHGDWDFWVIKLKEDGIMEWQKTYGGSQYESAEACIQTSDGGYVITGMTHSGDGDVSGNHMGPGKVWVIKLNSSGVIEWNKVWGGFISWDYPTDIIETNTGEIVIVGNSLTEEGDFARSDGFILCLESSGLFKWNKYYGGENDDYLSSIIQGSDGNLIAAGATISKEGEFVGNNGCSDGWLMAVNSSGNPIFNKTFGSSDNETFNSVIQTTEGNFVTVGVYNRELEENRSDILLTKITASGSLIWSKCFGGSVYDDGYHVIESEDKSMFIIGTTTSNDGDVISNHGTSDAWVVKLNSSGEIMWNQTFGGNMWDYGEAILQNSFGNIVVAGTTQSNNGDLTGNKGGRDFWIFNILQP